MTSPNFSDRDAATRDMMGPPSAQQHLRAAMRVSTDPKWVQQQLSPFPIEKPSRRIPWAIVAVVAVGIVLAGIGIARASEPPRPWIVWNVDADRPWTSAKGHQATATGPTACNLSLHEAAKVSPDGSRLSCRRIDQRKEQ